MGPTTLRVTSRSGTTGRPLSPRGAVGSVVAAGLLGLRDALEGRPEREEVTIVSEAPEREPAPIDVQLDLEHPERSVAVVRPTPPTPPSP